MSLLTDKSTGLQEAKLQETAPPVVVVATPNESKQRPPEDVVPSIGQIDTPPPPSMTNEENVPVVENEARDSVGDIGLSNAPELSGAVSKALENIPDTTKLGNTFTAAFETVSGNTPVLAGVGVTATAALVASLVGLLKDENASGSNRSQFKTDADLDSTKTSVARRKDDDRLDT